MVFLETRVVFLDTTQLVTDIGFVELSSFIFLVDQGGLFGDQGGLFGYYPVGD